MGGCRRGCRLQSATAGGSMDCLLASQSCVSGAGYRGIVTELVWRPGAQVRRQRCGRALAMRQAAASGSPAAGWSAANRTPSPTRRPRLPKGDCPLCWSDEHSSLAITVLHLSRRLLWTCAPPQSPACAHHSRPTCLCMSEGSQRVKHTSVTPCMNCAITHSESSARPRPRARRGRAGSSRDGGSGDGGGSAWADALCTLLLLQALPCTALWGVGWALLQLLGRGRAGGRTA